MPLGETPVLVTQCKAQRRQDGVHLLSLYPSRGQGIDLSLDTRLLHIVCKLMRDAVARADWDLQLAVQLVATGEVPATPAPIPKSQLN